MYCMHCGAALRENIRFCSGCGAQTTAVPDSHPYAGGGHVGFSNNIHDPAFARYIKNTNRWSVILSSILAVAAVVGFFIYGETGSEMENPEALLIGLGIGGMFLVIAIFTIKRSKTWDGVVVHKTSKQKLESRGVEQDSVYHTEYRVFIKDEREKIRKFTFRNDPTWYNYFQVGDRVRHHAGLKTYEKYDKSRDNIIYCNACHQVHDINADICSRCKCPLLK